MATNEKVMKEASEHARLADEANERAAEKEASAAKLREQADKLSAEAAEERALASRELSAAQLALRDGGIGTNPQPAGSVLRHERTAMDDKQTSSSEKGFPWGVLAAIAAVITLLLVLAWLWPFGAKTGAAEKLEVPISGLKSDVGALSTKVDGLGSAIKGVDSKLDTLKGEVGTLTDCACDKKEPPKASTRPRAAKPVKPTAAPVRPEKSADITSPPVAAPTRFEDRFGTPLDRCIFRINGEIKADTYVQNGKINCPKWRDEQLVLFKQDPKNLIWEKTYPSVRPK